METLLTSNIEAPQSGGTPAPIPERIGRYVDLKPIGQGAMGRVYRARDPQLERTVAIKVILPGSAIFHEEMMVRRFRREARIAASLNHPGIVTIYELGEDEGGFFLVMEYLEGEDLGQTLKKRALGQLEARLDLIEAICAAVAHAHEQGLVHRDLKPSNIFRLRDGRIKILDFGLARLTAGPRTTLGIAGTPHYMSPEQVRGEDVDERSDIFSLGALAYEILTDQRSFPATNLHAVLFQVLQRQQLPVHSLRPDLPELADLIVAKALTKDPELRFARAGDLLAAMRLLRRLIRGEISDAAALAQLDLGRSAETARRAESEALTLIAPRGGEAARIGALASPSSGSAQVVFREAGGEIALSSPAAEKKTLLDLALAAGIPCYHECGGKARCSTCRVRVVDGQGLLPRTELEARLASRAGWGPEIRLACQSAVIGDVKVQRLIHDTADFGLLRGERKGRAAHETTLAALAVRIRNSAQVLQRSAPYDVVHLLNRLFYEVGEPILAAGGEISEYRDAGLIAYFGLDEKNARAKCLAAVRAGLEIVLRLRGFVRYVRDHFGFEPEVGLGVHFGRAIVGSVGHPTRQFVSALGDINPIAFWLTSVEPLNEPYLLATEEIVNQIEDELRLGEVLTGAGPRSFDRNVWEIHDMHKPDGVTLIRRSFEKVLANRRGAADLFYRLLFEIDPSTRALFAHVDLEAQGDKLMEVLGVAVKGLDRLETLVPTLRELGRRHAGYGVELRHFASVEQALLETLSQMLGPEFTPELKGHWSAAIGALAGEMITGGWQQAA